MKEWAGTRDLLVTEEPSKTSRWGRGEKGAAVFPQLLFGVPHLDRQPLSIHAAIEGN
jgi:hypothetical protein